MPKKSLKELAAFLRASGAATQDEIEGLLRKWRVVLREEAMQVLKGPGDTCVVLGTGKSKEELLVLQFRSIVADEGITDSEELPHDDENEGKTP